MLRALVLCQLVVFSATTILWSPARCWSQQATATAEEEVKEQSQKTEKKAALVPVFSFNQSVLEAPVGDDPLFGS